MRLIFSVATALLVGVAAALTPMNQAEAQDRCRETGSEARPAATGQVFEIRTPSGPFRFRKAEWTRRCSRNGNAWVESKVGLTDETGRRPLVAARYDDVTPISDTMALVRTGNGAQPYRYYQYGVGETGVSPYFHAGLRTNDQVATPTASSSPNGDGDLFIFEGASAPTRVVGGQVALMSGASSNLLVNFTNDAGQPLSRIVDPAMRPLSPVIGRVEVWTTFPTSFAFNGPTTQFPREVVSQAMRFEHPLLPYDTLYIPITADGTPLPLPEGAVGVFPLKRSNLPPGALFGDQTFGWAVVFPTRDGFEIAPVLAPLAQALQQAPTARRYTGMRRSPTDLLMLRDAEGWRPATPALEPIHYIPAEAVFSDPDEGFLVVAQTWREQSRRQSLERREREAQLAAARQAQADAQWARVASGEVSLCGNVNPSFLPPVGLERFFRECDIDRNTQAIFGSKVSAEALAMAVRRRDSAEQQLAEQRRQRAQQAPQTSGDPWARGVAAAEAAVDASMNAFMQRQNETYQRNLAAWNSGAQNWRPAPR